jgi:hypothetical protein
VSEERKRSCGRICAACFQGAIRLVIENVLQEDADGLGDKPPVSVRSARVPDSSA